MSAYAAAQTDRIVGNLIRFGRIESVDYQSGTATVDFDGEIIEGLVWAVPRAGDDREYRAPSKDEQVCVLSPSGDLAQGVIAFSISQERFPNAGTDQNPKTVYADGTVVEYNKQSHMPLNPAAMWSSSAVQQQSIVLILLLLGMSLWVVLSMLQALPKCRVVLNSLVDL